MNIDTGKLAGLLKTEQFPLSSKYDPEWVLRNQTGRDALRLTEWLSQKTEMKPGMRVLDMGCGKAISSIFLAKEFGVQVWANDLWISASDNWQRIQEAGLEHQVRPIHAEAHSLSYAEEFFDAILCVDAYAYFGTEDPYLDYFRKFVRPEGQIETVVLGLMPNLDSGVPEHLAPRQESDGAFWGSDCWSFHPANWWRHHWERTGLVQVEVADVLPEGWRLWLQFDRARIATGTNQFPSDEEALEADGGRYIALVRLVSRRRE